MERRGWKLTAVAVAWCAAIAACGGGGSGDDESSDDQSSSSDDASAVPGDGMAGWTVESPEEHGMDPEVLAGAQEYAFADGMNTQGVVVIRDGVVVADWYAPGADEMSWAASWSVAKSFTSALIGIAIEEGKIPGVDEPMTTWYPEWEGTDKADMTLRDVLQMSSGLDWSEDYDPGSTGESDVIQMGLSPDELTYAAAEPFEVEPGTRFNYSSGDTMLLSGVIEQATGMPAGEYAEEKLFGPLGFEQVDWWRDAEDHTLTYCCVDTTSRDFARLGLLYLNEGRWGDEQVVPSSWVEDSIQPAEPSDGDYGYQWWLEDFEGIPTDTFSAQGHDGQFIYVIPSLDLIVVRNGTYVKDPGEPVADPNLFGVYPPDDLVPGKGTKPPEGGIRRWDPSEFLGPIVQSVTDR